jgi:protein TonB
VRPADRLGFTLFLAALIHLALLLGVGFTMVEPKQISKTWKSPSPPSRAKEAEKADFLAQENQQGSGTLDKKAIPKTTEVAPFQDTKSRKSPRRLPPSRKYASRAEAAVTTVAPKPQRRRPRPKKPKPKPSRGNAPTSTARSCPATSPASKPNWPTNNSCTPSARASTA